MGIDEEIKSSFKNEHQKLLVNIVYTNGWLNTKHTHILKPYGISIQQYNILRILRGAKKACSIQTLCERMLDKNSNASRLVEKLRLKEYVKRITSKNDRRQVNVSITEKGLSVLHSLDSEITNMELNLHHVTKEEANTVNQILDKLRS